MNAPQITPNSDKTDQDTQKFHHHTRDVTRMNDLDGHRTLHALCGVERLPLHNPLAYPCCPKCNRYLKRPCISQDIS